MVGSHLTEAIKLITLACKGMLPEAGGTLEQSAWFLSAWRQLEHDQNQIEQEQNKRRK